MKPQLTDDQCHPEEGVYSMVSEDIWRTHMMDDGVVEDDFQLRKVGNWICTCTLLSPFLIKI